MRWLCAGVSWLQRVSSAAPMLPIVRIMQDRPAAWAAKARHTIFVCWSKLALEIQDAGLVCSSVPTAFTAPTTAASCSSPCPQDAKVGVQQFVVRHLQAGNMTDEISGRAAVRAYVACVNPQLCQQLCCELC